MGTLAVLGFFITFAGGAVLYGAIEHKVTSRPAPRRARRGDAAMPRRCPRPLARPSREFPVMTERVARLLLASGAVKWK